MATVPNETVPAKFEVGGVFAPSALASLRPKEIAALLMVMAAPGILTIVAPVFIDGLMRPVADGGMAFSASLSGGMGTAELLAGAFTAFALGGRGLRPRVIVVMGACLALAANLICLMIDSPLYLLVLRAVAGIGLGAVGASGASLLSRLSDPDKAAAYSISLGTAIGSASLLVLPALVEASGARAIFVVFAAIAGLAALAGFALPWSQSAVPSASGAQNAIAAAPEARPNMLSLLGVAGLLFLIVGDSTLYSFAVPYGAHVGLSSAETGRLLAGYTILGIFAAAAAGPVATRFGRLWPIIVLCALKVVASLAIAYSTSALEFIVAQGVLAVAIFSTQPWFLGAIAALDRSGRSNALASGCLALGAAAGPVIGGFLFQHGPFWSLPASAAAITALSLVLGAVAAVAARARVNTVGN